MMTMYKETPPKRGLFYRQPTGQQMDNAMEEALAQLTLIEREHLPGPLGRKICMVLDLAL